MDIKFSKLDLTNHDELKSLADWAKELEIDYLIAPINLKNELVTSCLCLTIGDRSYRGGKVLGNIHGNRGYEVYKLKN